MNTRKVYTIRFEVNGSYFCGYGSTKSQGSFKMARIFPTRGAASLALTALGQRKVDAWAPSIRELILEEM